MKLQIETAVRWLGLACLASALVACGTPRPQSPPEALACTLQQFEVHDIYEGWRAYRKSPSSARALNDATPSFNVLALSAGGEFGAYGAGFLNGWRSVGAQAVPGPRDDIQIVTGVSTGSILATHAFLGRDQEIEATYRALSGPQIFKLRNPLTWLWANSLLDTSGKDRLIEASLSDEVIDAVANAAPDRFLYVGIANLDDGSFMRIDMLKLARSLQPKALRNACYRAVIGASSAVPLTFEPKFIDDRMMVDGGARRHLFLTALPEEAKQAGVTRKLVSFVHGDLDVGCQRTRNGVLQIAARTSSLMTDQSFKDSIRMMDTLAKAPVVPGSSQPTFQTFYAAASAAARACAPERDLCSSSAANQGEDMFCRPFMNCLADRGKEDGRAYADGSRAWLQIADLNLSSQPTCERSPEPSTERRALIP